MDSLNKSWKKSPRADAVATDDRMTAGAQILFDLRAVLVADGERHLAGRLQEDGCDWHTGDRQLFVAQFADLEIVQQYLGVRCAADRKIKQNSCKAGVRLAPVRLS
eukprot:1185172-Prorocentrum_minimum.AAC.4